MTRNRQQSLLANTKLEIKILHLIVGEKLNPGNNHLNMEADYSPDEPPGDSTDSRPIS
jgi:hypothetical protein